jgi:hypothetical protein
MIHQAGKRTQDLFIFYLFSETLPLSQSASPISN